MEEKISIETNESRKVLKYNGITYSIYDSNSLYTHMYWDFFIPLPLLFQNPKILIIGLGGGTILYQFDSLYANSLSIEVAEISKSMLENAKSFTGIDLSKFKIYLEDGSKVVKGKENYYDLIILDAYLNDRIPKQFLKEEFIADAYKALKNEGILAINYAKKPSIILEYLYFKVKLSKYFKLYKVNGGSRFNTILIASKSLTNLEIYNRISSRMSINQFNKFIIEEYSKLISKKYK
jgi:spermidine synthase